MKSLLRGLGAILVLMASMQNAQALLVNNVSVDYALGEITLELFNDSANQYTGVTINTNVDDVFDLQLLGGNTPFFWTESIFSQSGNVVEQFLSGRTSANMQSGQSKLFGIKYNLAETGNLESYINSFGNHGLFDVKAHVDGGGFDYAQYELQPTVVPVPTAAWLFGSGLIGLLGIVRRKKAA